MYVIEWKYKGYDNHANGNDSMVVALAKLFEDKSIPYWVFTSKGKTVECFDYLVKDDFPGWNT